MVGHVAGRFARSSSVAGYDVMNEPNAFGPQQVEALRDLYGRSLQRSGGRAHGPRSPHLLFFEPSVVWSDSGGGVPPAFARRPRPRLRAPHLHGRLHRGADRCRALPTGPRRCRGVRWRADVTGEWGSRPRPGLDRRATPTSSTHQRLQDEFRFGATLWTWRESCGDPHKVGDIRGRRADGLGRVRRRLPHELDHRRPPRPGGPAHPGVHPSRARSPDPFRVRPGDEPLRDERQPGPVAASAWWRSSLRRRRI